MISPTFSSGGARCCVVLTCLGAGAFVVSASATAGCKKPIIEILKDLLVLCFFQTFAPCAGHTDLSNRTLSLW